MPRRRRQSGGGFRLDGRNGFSRPRRRAPPPPPLRPPARWPHSARVDDDDDDDDGGEALRTECEGHPCRLEYQGGGNREERWCGAAGDDGGARRRRSAGAARRRRRYEEVGGGEGGRDRFRWAGGGDRRIDEGRERGEVDGRVAPERRCACPRIAASLIDDRWRYHMPPSRHCRRDCRCRRHGGFMAKREAAGGDWLAATTAQRRREVDAGDDKSGHR